MNRGDDEAVFRQFVAGNEFSEDRIVGLIERAGQRPARVNRLAFGYFRKAVAIFEADEGPTKVAKIALHPFSVGLLNNEFAGRQAAAWKNHAPPVLIDDGISILLSDFVQGAPAGKKSYLTSVAAPFAGIEDTIPAEMLFEPLKELAGRTGQKERLRYIEQLLDSAPRAPVPVSASHGDFVYWNCIRTRNGLFALDYEAYSEVRIAGYDISYWYLLPAARRAVAFGGAALGSKLLMGVLPLLWNRVLRQDPALHGHRWGDHSPRALVFGYTLLDHAIRMGAEDRMPESMAFLGPDSLELRRSIRAVYDAVLDRILNRL